MEKVFKAIPKNSGNTLTLPWILFWAFQNTMSTLFALMSLLCDACSFSYYTYSCVLDCGNVTFR